jgi:two-component system, NtrC family, response regulator AtoC
LTEDSMEQSSQILVVSQERSARNLSSLRADNGWHLETVFSAWEALERVRSVAGLDLVVLDLAQDETEGLHPLRWLRRIRPDLPVLVLADSGNPDQKLEALRLGAQDYLVRPLHSQQLEAAIQRSLHHTGNAESEVVADEIEQIGEEMFFVSASPTMRKLRAQAELLAQVSAPVFILGEFGSGKELAARLIHKLSVRGGFRFLRLDCSTLPGDVLESELFGMTDGNGRIRPGKMELCNRGTLMLDEITEMPLSLQAKLLHVLQQGCIVRQGSERRVDIDVRILAASGANLQQAVASRKLREDLYYRLSSFTVHVPALRQRKEEIPLLLSHFMNTLARRYGLPARIFSAAAQRACQQHSWPGNLSEMEKFVKRYLVMGDGSPNMDVLAENDEMAFWDAYLPSASGHRGRERRAPEQMEPQRQSAMIAGTMTAGTTISETTISGEINVSGPRPSGLKSLVQSVKGEAERNAIAGALAQAGWNRKAAARLLKVSYRTLLYKIEHYQMSPPAATYNGTGYSRLRPRSTS